MACLVAWASMSVTLGAFTVVWAKMDRVALNIYDHSPWTMENIIRLIPLRTGHPTGIMLVPWGDRVGIAVAGAWLALRMSGRWHPEPSWLDRLGRVLGWAWIAAAATVWSLPFLW